jgi:chitin disaccharide deacetylase
VEILSETAGASGQRPPSTAAVRAICICVDDYGLHDGIDEACHRLVEQRRIGALSVMTDGPTWPRSAMPLRRVSPDVLDVGLHLNFTEVLGGAGPVWPLKSVLWRAPLHLLPRQAIRESIRRQLGGLVEAMGRAPAHVDGHQHVQQLPVVRDLLLDELGEAMTRLGLSAGAPGSPWLRCGLTPSSPDLPERRKARIIEAFGARAWARVAQGQGWRCSRHLLGVYGFDADASRLAQLWQAWLTTAGAEDVVMCHPAVHAPAGDVIGPARQQEFQWLSGPAFGRMLSEAGVTVRPWGQGLASVDRQGSVGAT